jgi:hypothetical protein
MDLFEKLSQMFNPSQKTTNKVFEIKVKHCFECILLQGFYDANEKTYHVACSGTGETDNSEKELFKKVHKTSDNTVLIVIKPIIE